MKSLALLVLPLLLTGLTACREKDIPNSVDPSASPSASASPSGDPTLPGDIPGSVVPSSSPGASATPRPGSSASPSPTPSASPSGKPGSVTFRLQVVAQGESTCPATKAAVAFRYQLRQGDKLTERELSPSQIKSDGSVDIVLSDVKAGETLTLTIPAIVQNGATLYGGVTRRATARDGRAVLETLNLPIGTSESGGAYEIIAGDNLDLVEDLEPLDDTVVSAGSQVEKGWLVSNASQNITWSNRNLASIDPETGYAPSLIPIDTAIPVPDLAANEQTTLRVNLQVPSRPGLYRSNWMLKNRSTGKLMMPEMQLYTQLRVEGTPRFTPVLSGDAYGTAETSLQVQGNRYVPMAINYPVTTGTAFQVLYKLANTGSRTWTGRTLVFTSEGAVSRHQLEPSRRSLTIPDTAPGAVATIGPVVLKITGAESHFAAWRMQDSSGRNSFSGDPEIVTQVAVTPALTDCK
jgi:hypothetical protein